MKNNASANGALCSFFFIALGSALYENGLVYWEWQSSMKPIPVICVSFLWAILSLIMKISRDCLLPRADDPQSLARGMQVVFYIYDFVMPYASRLQPLLSLQSSQSWHSDLICHRLRFVSFIAYICVSHTKKNLLQGLHFRRTGDCIATYCVSANEGRPSGRRAGDDERSRCRENNVHNLRVLHRMHNHEQLFPTANKWCSTSQHYV